MHLLIDKKTIYSDIDSACEKLGINKAELYNNDSIGKDKIRTKYGYSYTFSILPKKDKVSPEYSYSRQRLLSEACGGKEIEFENHMYPSAREFEKSLSLPPNAFAQAVRRNTNKYTPRYKNFYLTIERKEDGVLKVTKKRKPNYETNKTQNKQNDLDSIRRSTD